jgi:hypothetical protein
MTRRTALLLSLGLLFAAGLLVVACGDDAGSLYFKPLQTRQFELKVMQSHDITVRLSAEVSRKTYVDVENEYSEFIKAEPATLRYDPGESTKQVTITGLEPTNNQFFPVVFKLRDSDETRTLSVQVYDDATP